MTLAHTLYNFLWHQQWLSLRWKKHIYKRLSQTDSELDAPFSKDFYGLLYQGNLNNSIEFNIFYYGAFEKPLLFFLRDTLQGLSAVFEPGTPTVFVDIGANIGQHSLFMSRVADQVLAFEPYAPVRDRLQHHIALNQIKNIQVHTVGLSERKEELPFFAPTGHNQGIGSFDANSVTKGNKPIGNLQLVNGDDYFATHNLPLPVLVKIDVEGFEKQVLKGLSTLLQDTRPVLVTEITYGQELSFSSRAELLSALPPDYQLFAFNTRKADGSKARKRGARARRTGHYELIEFTRWLDQGQDDVVACPQEKLAVLPRSNSA